MARSQTRPSVTIVLPIFNEASNLGRLFDRIERALAGESVVYRILAVDDGSTDGTPEVLQDFHSRAPLEVYRHGSNLGLGMAIRSGLLEALKVSSESDIIVTMDADDSHAPSLIVEMLAAIESGSDVVIASRFQPGSQCVGVPAYRKVLSVGASFLFRIVFPTPGVRDFTCGFRAYRVSVLRRALEKYGSALFEFEGFQSMVDLLLKLRALDARFSEVPVVLRYDLKEGPSKMPVFRTTMRTLRLAVQRRLGL